MKLLCVAAIAISSLAVPTSVALGQPATALSLAQSPRPGEEEQAIRQRVVEHVTQRYGNGTPIATAALVFAKAAAELWITTARTQTFDALSTERAGIREICFRGQLAAAGVPAPDLAVAELETIIASTPTTYAGAAYATALALQQPRALAMTPAQACRQANVPLP